VKPPARQTDTGVVLINVLVILAIASVVVFLMLSSQEQSLQRAQTMAQTTTANALARGAEASAVTALRRDMLKAPETDNYAESWAQVDQQQATLAVGTLTVTLRDAQAKLNLTRLAGGAQNEVQALLRVLAELNISRAEGAGIAAEIAARPGLKTLSDLQGIAPATRTQLDPYVGFLPSQAQLNLNTADPLLLRAVLNNNSAALRLVQRRSAKGLLTAEDITLVGAAVPGMAGFTSQNFDVQTVVKINDLTLTLTSRVQRSQNLAGQSVRVVSRAYGVPLNSVPPLPPTLLPTP